jgi:hypothetical protein
MVSQCYVRPTSEKWLWKIVQMIVIHLIPCRNPCRCYIHLAFAYSVGGASSVVNLDWLRLFHQRECVKWFGHGPAVSCVKSGPKWTRSVQSGWFRLTSMKIVTQRGRPTKLVAAETRSVQKGWFRTTPGKMDSSGRRPGEVDERKRSFRGREEGRRRVKPKAGLPVWRRALINKALGSHLRPIALAIAG